jgi:hypothetical protein
VRGHLLALPTVLAVALSAATWAFVKVGADRAVAGALEADLARAVGLVTRLHAEQLTRLGLTARLVASFPELKALFATDVITIRDFLLGYQQRTPGTPMLVALGPDGSVIARTDTAEGGPDPSGAAPLAPVLDAPDAQGVVSLDGRPYHAAGSPSEAGGMVFGYLVAVAPIGEAFARAASEATQDEVILLSDDEVLASTLLATQTPWQSLGAWRAGGGRADRSIEVGIGPQRYAAREVPLTEVPAVSAIVVKSRDEAIEPYRGIERGVVGIGILAVALAIFGSVWLWRTIRQG